MSKINSGKEFSERQKIISLKHIPISDLEVGEYNPRENLKDDIQELATNVSNEGIIQPLVVRNEDGKYEVIAGARRLEAARMVALDEVPCVVRDLTVREAERISLEENIHRKELDPKERAKAVENLVKLNGTKRKVAQILGVSEDTLSEWLAPLQIERDALQALKPARGSTSQKKVKWIAGLPKSKQAEVAAAIKDVSPQRAKAIVQHVKTNPEEEIEEAIDVVEHQPEGQNISTYFEPNIIRAIENACRELDIDKKGLVRQAVVTFLRTRNYLKKKVSEED